MKTAEIRRQESEISKGIMPSALLVALCYAGALLFPLCLPAGAQQQKRAPRHIGLLMFTDPQHGRQAVQPFLRGLRELGWIEGQNITIERRYANDTAARLPDLAAELVGLQVDLHLPILTEKKLSGLPPAVGYLACTG